jgi:hypothetical protein
MYFRVPRVTIPFLVCENALLLLLTRFVNMTETVRCDRCVLVSYEEKV